MTLRDAAAVRVADVLVVLDDVLEKLRQHRRDAERSPEELRKSKRRRTGPKSKRWIRNGK